MNKTVFAAVLAASAAIAWHPAQADISVTHEILSEVTRPTTGSKAIEISGITYAGDNLYYAVDDADNKLYPITIAINRSTGKIATSDISIGTGVSLADSDDIEGCAFDPASGKVWVSQEKKALIREFDPVSGALLRSAPVPSVMKKYHGNFSLEALTISGDGKTMWTCNEEGLKADADMLPGVGSVSTKTTGSTVRLTRFTRESVYDNWTADGQWAYVTQPVGTDPDWSKIVTNANGTKTTNYVTRSGISGLCALPDGTLLALERRCYKGGFYPDFNVRIYKVNFSGATDISSIPSLKNATYQKAGKTLLWENPKGKTEDPSSHWTQDMPNFEGICLGPRLNDGSCALVLITDGGSSAVKEVMTLKLNGLNIRTLNVNTPAPVGTPSFAGRNYRFLNNAEVTVDLLGEGVAPTPYTNRCDLVFSSSWSLPAHSKSGTGPHVKFNITKDDTLSWTVAHTPSLANTPIYAHDTFENYAPGTHGSGVKYWTGDGEVISKTYTPYQGANKYILKRQGVDHKKVLDAEDGAIRSLPMSQMSNISCHRMDIMVEVHPSAENTLDTPPENTRVAIAADKNRKLQIWHYGFKNGAIRPFWSSLGTTVYPDRAWVRVSVEVTNTTDCTYGRVRVNGSLLSVEGGNSTPTKRTSAGNGQWFPMKSLAPVSCLSLVGTKADDFIIATPSFIDSPAAQSIVVAPGETNGTGSSGPTFTVAVAVPAAAAPVAARPRSASSAAANGVAEPADAVSAPAITGFGLTPDNCPRIRFTGFAEGAVYRVVRSSSIDFKGDDVESLDGMVTDSDNGVAVWEGKYACDPSAGAKFYRIEVVK